jgi:hypothetical protein
MSDERLLTAEEQDKAVADILKMLTKCIPMSALSKDTIKFGSYDAIASAQDTKTTKHFNEVVIPAAIKAAREELMAEVNEIFGVCPHDCLPDECSGCHRYSDKKFCPIIKLQQLKQKEG